MQMQVHAIKGPQKIDENLPEINPDARQNAATVHQALAEEGQARGDENVHEVVQAVAGLLVWPILWVFWAGLTRGGLSLAMARLAVGEPCRRRAPRAPRLRPPS